MAVITETIKTIRGASLGAITPEVIAVGLECHHDGGTYLKTTSNGNHWVLMRVDAKSAVELIKLLSKVVDGGCCTSGVNCSDYSKT